MKKILLVFSVFITTIAYSQNPIFYMLVGTYTNAPSKSDGIYVYKFNPNKGEATFISKAAGVSNPSYIAISKDQKYVYCVNENHGDAGGDVSAFSFDKTKGELHLLNKQPSGGDDPCYISIDSTGKNVIVANYSGGNLSVLKTNIDGSLQPAAQTIAHEGYGVNVERQGMPHPHGAVFSPDEKFLYVPDLGNDRLYVYQFDAANPTTPLTASDPAYYEVPDNSGPRHFTFHPNGKFAYLLNELSGKVIVYGCNNGKLTELQTIASDNKMVKGDKGSADLCVTPNGKYLFTSNRAPSNDITHFKIQSDGTLLEAAHVPVGLHPRNFMIDPTGRFLLVANRESNNIQIFVINKNYGLLTDSNVKIDIDQPVCIKMVPIK